MYIHVYIHPIYICIYTRIYLTSCLSPLYQLFSCFNLVFCRSAVEVINKAFVLKGFRSSFPDHIKVNLRSLLFVDAVVKTPPTPPHTNISYEDCRFIQISEREASELLNKNFSDLTKYSEWKDGAVKITTNASFPAGQASGEQRKKMICSLLIGFSSSGILTASFYQGRCIK